MNPISSLKNLASERAPEWMLRGARRTRSRLRETLSGKAIVPRRTMPFGVEPLSYLWGNDRGTALHRHYLDAWLKRQADAVHGRVLEFQSDLYATALGGKAIAKVDVLHVDHSNPKATLVGDITIDNDLPKAAFDAIICTYVLHLIFDVHGAIRGLHSLLKPGGTLLLAVPQTSMDDPYYSEFWRFTSRGLRRSLEQTFSSESLRIESFGNSLVTAGELRGLVAEEFSSAELAVQDERFASLHCARVRR